MSIHQWNLDAHASVMCTAVQSFYTTRMQTQYVVALTLFAVITAISFLFQIIIILDFRSTLKKRSAFYHAIGSPESTGSWRTLSFWYIFVIVLITLGTGILFVFQPHLY